MIIRLWLHLSARIALIALLVPGCGSPAIPDPKPAVARYVAAVRRGDDQALWAMLSAKAQRDLGRTGVKRLLGEQKHELWGAAQSVSDPHASLQIDARTQFLDGEVATFSVEQGELRLRAAAALPAHATTPEQALSDLRAALARRSYAGLISVLSADSATSLEEKMTSLVHALQNPEALEIVASQGRAVVELPNGHHVELIKDQGLWKIRDFE